MNKENQIAWLAGILEGEGTFIFYRRKDANGFRVLIQISSTDLDIIQRIALMWNTPVKKHHFKTTLTKNAKLMWACVIQQSRAIRVMKAILPYMGYRRSERINYILSNYVNTKRKHIPRVIPFLDEGAA